MCLCNVRPGQTSSVIVRSKMVWDILMNSIRAKEKMEENWKKNGNKATIQRMKH